MKKINKTISIISAILIAIGASALPVHADTAHKYYSMTGFCNVCGKTINEGNHTNKITNTKGGIVHTKDEEDGIPVLPEIVDAEEDNGIPVIPEITDVNENVSEHEYFGTTGFCDVCGKTVNEGNHTNKITNTKDGVVEGKGEGVRKPIVTENTVTLKLNGDLVNIECKSGTYKEIFDYLKNKGYSDFIVKNYWNTTVYSWYKYDSNKICSAIINDNTEDETDGIPVIPEIIGDPTSVNIDGKTVEVCCGSGTYKEVFDYVRLLGYTDFTVKNRWGTQVYSWYNLDNDNMCNVTINK